jgi:septal ring factor EnvC (AmiA/AmiB activator)
MARQMEDIIARLEQEQRRRQTSEEPQVRLSATSFEQLQGRLKPPIRGKIVDTFGWKQDKITNLKSFSPGIVITPRQGQKEVLAAAPGRVVYVGRLRGYENFVILEHDDGFFTTYAGLSSVYVDLGELINTGKTLGAPGRGDTRFEIRRGREHLDPVIWLNIDEF